MPINEMNNLIKKIERRLGTRVLMLPEHLSKDHWAEEAIIPDSLVTFSRFFPHMVTIKIDTNDQSKKKDGFFIIDEALLGGAKILGVKDIDWSTYGQEDGGLAQQSGIGYYDYMSTYNNYSCDDVMLIQARADITSMFNNTIFVNFKEPNMIKLESVTHGDITGGLGCIPLDVFVCHPPNLMTIPGTMMEVFENLATSDVASFLFNELQHYEGLETVFAGVDYKLNRLEDWSNRRSEYVGELNDSYVSASNKNQPLMYCV